MATSPFPGMDPYLEVNPRWQVFHGWFIRELARQSVAVARDLGCVVDVERSVYGREPTGELVLIGEPDMLAITAPENQVPSRGLAGASLAAPQAVHEVVLDPDEMEIYKQEYLVVRESGEFGRILAVVELLSFANKQGSYVPKYREKRSHFMTSSSHFMEIDFLRTGMNPARDQFPELPHTPYFIFVARKTGMGRNEEGYLLRLQDPLPTVGLPLGPNRPDLPLDLAEAFRSAYDLTSPERWVRYGKEPVPGPPLSDDDQAWVDQIVTHLHEKSSV